MPNIVADFVKNGVVVPDSPLPEGAQVEIQIEPTRPEVPEQTATRVSPSELRKMPREQRQVILAAAAEKAEEDYRSDRDRIGFDAFSDKERDEEGS